ncbi:MAG: DUF554 domain-containing protein [Eubacteriales bacterium]|nr:DUF554 domain-containing protein [Eubacteriales bacterium]
MAATLINAGAIIAGSLIGWKAGRLLSDKASQTLITVLALVVFSLGVEMMLQWGDFVLQVIVSLVIGGLAGELMDIEGFLAKMGAGLQKIAGARLQGDVAKGFVYGTLVYCIGPMAIIGAMESGLNCNHEILLAKAAIDGLTAIAFASTLGLGVMFSGGSVLLYQGLLTLGARYLADVLTIAGPQLTATGGILLMALGIKMLDIKQVRVANLLPALPVTALLAWIF